LFALSFTGKCNVSLGAVFTTVTGLSRIGFSRVGFSKSITEKKGVAVEIINDINVMPAMAKN
jgi:hypothetical protein